MSKRYYIFNSINKKGFEEVTEEQWNNLIGEHPISSYANQIYHEIITIDDVPYEYRDEVEMIVCNKIDKWGEYKSQIISSLELQNMLEEVL